MPTCWNTTSEHNVRTASQKWSKADTDHLLHHYHQIVNCESSSSRRSSSSELSSWSNTNVIKKLESHTSPRHEVLAIVNNLVMAGTWTRFLDDLPSSGKLPNIFWVIVYPCYEVVWSDLSGFPVSKTNGNARKRGKFIQLPSPLGPLRRKYTSTWILLAVTTYTRVNLAHYPHMSPSTSLARRILLLCWSSVSPNLPNWISAFIYIPGIKRKVHTIAIYATPEILLDALPGWTNPTT